MNQSIFILLGFLLIFSSSGASAASREAVYGDGAMVSSRSTLASTAGVKIMKQGGNAIDGAVATAFALAVTYPSAGNIGGGGFAVIYFQDGKVITQDHREMAPAAAHRDMYLDENGDEIKGLSRSTLLAAGVPGSVEGLLSLLEEYGTNTRKEVMAPAIKLAEEGFLLDPLLAEHINSAGQALLKNPAAAKKFTIDGRSLQAGDTWKQPDLAKTLRLISDKGRDGFYDGETADLIVREMLKGGGLFLTKILRITEQFTGNQFTLTTEDMTSGQWGRLLRPCWSCKCSTCLSPLISGLWDGGAQRLYT